MEQKNVIAKCNPIFRKEGQKGWPTGVDDSQLVLRFGYYYLETSDLLERSDFSSKLKEKVKGWSLSDLVCSALWFNFEKKQLSTYSWSIFFTFLMHWSCTDNVLFFLEFSFIDKILLREEIINGAFFALKNTRFFHVDINCLKNILIFLEIENNIIDEVILDITTQQNWKVIIEFLKENQNEILRKRNLSLFDQVIRLKKSDPSFANYFLLYKNEAEQKSGFWEKIQNSNVWGYSKLFFLAFFACKFFPRLSKSPSLVTNFQPFCAEVRIMELIELGHFYQGAGIAQAAFPRPVLMHLRRVSTVTSAAANEELVVENPELGVENQELGVENPELGVENKKLVVENPELGVENQELGVENQVVESTQKQGKLEFEFEKGNSGESSFSSEKQSLEAASSTEIDPIIDSISVDEWEQIHKQLYELAEQKEVNAEKNKDPFRKKDKLKRTISGFAPNHQLERTQSESIHGFFPTKELDRTNPKLSQDEATTSQLTEIGDRSQSENTTDSSLSSNDESLSSNDESVTTEKKFEKKR
jgi:hypothetical protein